MQPTRLAMETVDGVVLRAEAVLPAKPRAMAVVCHPHPLHGGTMHSHVVGALFDGLPQVGVATMRFNFRGTSGSEGRFGGGQAEVSDVVAAIDALIDLVGADDGPVPLLLAGYSFGADVALATDHSAIAGWFAVAAPLRIIEPEAMVAAADERPKQLVVGSDDEFRPPDQAEAITEQWPTTSVTTLTDQNHFLATAGPRILELAEIEVDALVSGRGQQA